jgi:8-oxo-dGTP pyrophosphatase MutT (NUDIX family)
MSAHRISAGVLVEHDDRLLMVHHVRPGRYDFWVAPGGGVQGDESCEDAARHEVWEETGLHNAVGRLLYVEDVVNPACRFVKFWFAGSVEGQCCDTSHSEVRREHIVGAVWLAPAEFAGKTIYPPLLIDRYAQDRRASFPAVVRLPMRRMEHW